MSVNQLNCSFESDEIFFFHNMNQNFFNFSVDYKENLIDLNSNNSYLSNNNNNINILSLSSVEENNLLSFIEEIYTNNVEENNPLSSSEEKYKNNLEENNPLVLSEEKYKNNVEEIKTLSLLEEKYNSKESSNDNWKGIDNINKRKKISFEVILIPEPFLELQINDKIEDMNISKKEKEKYLLKINNTCDKINST